MKVAVAQINPKIGDIAGNTAQILQAVRIATRQMCSQADAGAEPRIVLFPELCLTGYPPRDLLNTPSLVDKNLQALDEIAVQLPAGVAAIVGYVDRNRGDVGLPFYNAAALLMNGKVAGRYYKRLLPYYDVFDDERYFEPGTETVVWDVAGAKVGVTICEDAWNQPGFLTRSYAIDPVEQLASKCDLVVNLTASPFHVGKPEHRLRLFADCAREAYAPIVYCNQVGAHDDLIFDGSSFAVDRGGNVIGTAPSFSGGVVVFDLNAPERNPGFGAGFGGRPESQWIRSALELGLQDYCGKSGVDSVILGLSGGVDSAVVACIAAGALTPEKVIGVSLPSRHSSLGTRNDARELAKRIGIRFHEIPMDTAYDAYRGMLQPFLDLAKDGLIDENLQPRIRMIVLMALSQKYGALLLNTSNKSEIACGYATLYGDTAGALAVLGDLTKRRVYDLGRSFGDLIPQTILSRAPSAELRPDQKDEDSLPPYSLLDDLVTESVEEGLDRDGLLARHPNEKAHVDKYVGLYAGSEFKRFQTPPILRVTPRAFGRGRRIPLASTKPF